MNKRARIKRVEQELKPERAEIHVNMFWNGVIEVDGEKLTVAEYKKRYPRAIVIEANEVFGNGEDNE